MSNIVRVAEKSSSVATQKLRSGDQKATSTKNVPRGVPEILFVVHENTRVREKSSRVRSEIARGVREEPRVVPDMLLGDQEKLHGTPKKFRGEKQ